VAYCQVNAIKKDEDLTADEQVFLSLNKDLSRIWPVIESRGEVPGDADEWAEVPGKIKYVTSLK
jgi:ferredoxin